MNSVKRVDIVAAAGNFNRDIEIPQFKNGVITLAADQPVGANCVVSQYILGFDGTDYIWVLSQSPFPTLIPTGGQTGIITFDYPLSPMLNLDLNANGATQTNFAFNIYGELLEP